VIGYHLPHHADVSIAIYNLLGQTVYSFDLPNQPAGFHQVAWDGADRNGAESPSGVYFYRMIADDFRQTKKMLLLR
jgi:flagellar hook assembly protein FlgD